MTTEIKEINDIKELRKVISKIKKDAGVKRGEISVTTRESGFGLTVNIKVMKYTATAAAAVNAILKLDHGDQDDDIMTDYFGSNHLSIQWGFEFRKSDNMQDWYVSDQDVKTVEMVLKQQPDTIEKISDKTSASWHSEPETEYKKGFTTLALYKTEGFKRLTYFTDYSYYKFDRICNFATYIARYRFLHEI